MYSCENSDQRGHSRGLFKIVTGHITDSQGGIVSSCGQRRLSDCADARADLSLCWCICQEVRFLTGCGWSFEHGIITKTRLFKYIENFTTKNWKFLDKNSDIFPVSAQNIDCGYLLEPPRRGGSNEYPQSMFLSRNKKNNIYHCKPQFSYIKVGFKEAKVKQILFVCLLCLCSFCFQQIPVLWSYDVT